MTYGGQRDAARGFQPSPLPSLIDPHFGDVEDDASSTKQRLCQLQPHALPKGT
jgi:hypothetical protein